MADFKSKDYVHFAFKKITDSVSGDCPQCAIDSDYINIEYKQGKGHFKVLYHAIICTYSLSDYKKILGMLNEDHAGNDKAMKLHDMYVSMTSFLEDHKKHCQQYDKAQAAEIQAAIDKIVKKDSVLSEYFTIESVKADKPIRMKKDIAYKLVKDQIVIDYDAKSFVKFGYRWIVSKDSKIKGRYHIIVPCCGLPCAFFDKGNIRQAIEIVDEELKNKVVAIVDKAKNTTDFNRFYELLSQNGIQEIPYFEVKDSIDLVNETIQDTQNVTIEDFNKQYAWSYNLLYDAESLNKDLDYSDKVECFDLYIDDMKDIITAFNNLRSDYISSDRECAAFMMTIEHFTKIGKKTIDNVLIPDFSDIQDRIDNRQAMINTIEHDNEVNALVDEVISSLSDDPAIAKKQNEMITANYPKEWNKEIDYLKSVIKALRAGDLINNNDTRYIKLLSVHPVKDTNNRSSIVVTGNTPKYLINRVINTGPGQIG